MTVPEISFQYSNPWISTGFFVDNYDKNITRMLEKYFYIFLIFYHYFMSFSSPSATPDGEKNTAYQHLQDNTLPTPNWIDTEQNSSYEDVPMQLTFRHAES